MQFFTHFLHILCFFYTLFIRCLYLFDFPIKNKKKVLKDYKNKKKISRKISNIRKKIKNFSRERVDNSQKFTWRLYRKL